MLEWLGLLWQQPWYALTALAVTLPIVIHLLNRSRGKLVTFAHVALLRSTQAHPTTELRLTQFLLLLLRILLLLTAAALLAAPLWQGDEPEQDVIMLSQDWLNSSSASEKQQLASRLGTQQAIILDSPVAEELRQSVSSADIINWQSQSSAAQINLWSKIQSHAKFYAATRPLVIYATNRASQYVGGKVALSETLEWHIKNVNTDNNIQEKSLSVLSVMLIYQSDRQSDVNYLRAAFSALQKQSKQQIVLSVLSTESFEQSLINGSLSQAEGSKHQTKVIFWLSSAPLAPELLNSNEQTRSIIMDAPQLANQQWRLAEKDPMLKGLGGSALATQANIAFNTDLSQVLWQTQQGEPLLSQVNIGSSNLVQFYSRFNRQWNNLTTQPSFPLLLGNVIQTILVESPQLAQQFLDEQQITQKVLAKQQVEANRQQSLKHSDLSIWLGALLLLLFCVERIYSEKSGKLNKTKVKGEAH
jgi:hypothetical protein